MARQPCIEFRWYFVTGTSHCAARGPSHGIHVWQGVIARLVHCCSLFSCCFSLFLVRFLRSNYLSVTYFHCLRVFTLQTWRVKAPTTAQPRPNHPQVVHTLHPVLPFVLEFVLFFFGFILVISLSLRPLCWCFVAAHNRHQAFLSSPALLWAIATSTRVAFRILRALHPRFLQADGS